MDWEYIYKFLIFLWVANGSPIVAARVLKSRFATPVDRGYKLKDGLPLFGSSKTWRGIVFSLCCTTGAAYFLNFPLLFGLCFAILAMTGDLFSSFIKRRMGLAPSSQALFLDQLPESVIPVIGIGILLAMSPTAMLTTVILFFISEIFLSRILFRLHVRKRPY